MPASVARGVGPWSRADAERTLLDEGLAPRAWANAPGATYGAHAHPDHKVLVCVKGGIVFHTSDGDVALEAGDRLELPALVEHGATVGVGGVECVEAYRP